MGQTSSHSSDHLSPLEALASQSLADKNNTIVDDISANITSAPPKAKKIINKNSERMAKFERLEAAFEFFNDTSSMLEESYKVLEKRVSLLTKELDDVNAQKKQANNNEARLAKRMQALLDFLPGGVIVLDQQGIIIESNPAARQLLEDSLDGKLWRNVIASCFAPRNDDGLEVSTKTGKRISLSTSSMDNQGQIILLTDQTEARELQKNLSRYERLSMMGKMVSALAHQIRTPLSAAMLYAEHINNDSLVPEKKALFSKKLFSRLQHMERTVRDMLLFVKSELPLNDVISLEEFKYELIEAMEMPIEKAKAHVYWQLDNSGFTFRCHKEALISAVMNLINNALQAGEHPINITVNLSVVDHSKIPPDIQLSITDNGSGMDSTLLQQAQELFITTKSHGTGLGLAVVQSVAKAHGGQFSLESEIGKGTCARLILPSHISDAYSQSGLSFSL